MFLALTMPALAVHVRVSSLCNLENTGSATNPSVQRSDTAEQMEAWLSLPLPKIAKTPAYGIALTEQPSLNHAGVASVQFILTSNRSPAPPTGSPYLIPQDA
jgi:hypothetical protein